MNPTPYQPQGNSSSHGISGNSSVSQYGSPSAGMNSPRGLGSQTAHAQPNRLPPAATLSQNDIKPAAEPTSKLAIELNKFNKLAA